MCFGAVVLLLLRGGVRSCSSRRVDLSLKEIYVSVSTLEASYNSYIAWGVGAICIFCLNCSIYLDLATRIPTAAKELLNFEVNM